MAHAVPATRPTDLAPIRRALLSVFDKTLLIELAQALVTQGAEILSTGGTAKHLMEAGIPVTQVSDFTESPEIMGGRVKTLHPRVHGGILMRGDEDLADLERVGGKPIDLVAVNLYPFESTLARGTASHAALIEEIDIGGPSMLRSAAKSHPRVTVLADPRDYAAVIAELQAKGATTLATRARLAAKVFAHTSRYDGAIAAYLSAPNVGFDAPPSAQPDVASATKSADTYPGYLSLHFEKGYVLRYGENPHQSGAFYVDPNASAGTLALAQSVGTGGKELSFNNFVDVEAALAAVRDLDSTTPACVIVKHTNPCGSSTAPTLVDAYRLARDADPVSAFGGIVAFNREVDEASARAMAETFLECIVAPSFGAASLEILRAKKNLRLLAVGETPTQAVKYLDYRRIGGGLVTMAADDTAANEALLARVVSKRAPNADELAALEFAWRVSKHVKSNAIVLAKAGDIATSMRTVGVGAGQMSRVISVQIALEKAGSLAKGSVLASDAFFPFPDGVEAAIAGGVTAIAQPGGSVKDAEVIAAADRYNVAMVLTGFRHFRH